MSLHILIERDIIARYIYAFLCSANFALGLLNPRSIAYSLAQTDSGLAMIIASGVLAVLLVLDTTINDVMRPEYQLRWTSKHRHLLCVAGALIFLTALYGAARSPGGVAERLGSCYLYSGFAGIGLVVAWRDVRRRPGHALKGV